MEERRGKKDSGLMKSMSLIVDKTSPKLTRTESENNKKGSNNTYNFLAALRKVKKLSSEQIDAIYKKYNLVRDFD